MYGICNLSIVPCRKTPSDRSEMVTQLLFGETFEILDEKKKWIKIKNSFDQYVSWIDKKQYQPITQKTYSGLSKEQSTFSFDLVQPLINNSADGVLPIVLGSVLPRIKNHKFEIENIKYTYEGALIKPVVTKKTRSAITENAYLYLNTPYLWGGRSPFGIDCSGFTQMVLRLCGIAVLRDASQQATMGKAVDFVEEAQPGDLAFFDNDVGKITHVGIMLGNNKIIHASGKVRIDRLDHYGIYNEEKSTYSHSLRVIKALM